MQAVDEASVSRSGIRSRDLKRPFGFVLLAVVTVATVVLGLTIGAVTIPPDRVFSILANTITAAPASSDMMSVILLEIRVPRLFLGIMVGSSLAISGVLMQGLFRNPLADPSLVGVSSGASLGAATMILARSWFSAGAEWGAWLVAAAAFGGGVVATAIVYGLAQRREQTQVTTMLLAGIAINAVGSAGVGFLESIAQDDELRDITFWLLGSLSGATWTTVSVLVPVFASLLILSPWMAASLDGLLLGEAEAAHIGVSVEQLKRVAVLLAAAAVGASVAVSGMIFFVGLVVPHLVRLVAGPNHRRLLPGAAILGAILVVLADVVARVVLAPAELPLGIMTALLGAPFFLMLLSRKEGAF